jgi:hypothetical protein
MAYFPLIRHGTHMQTKELGGGGDTVTQSDPLPSNDKGDMTHGQQYDLTSLIGLKN